MSKQIITKRLLPLLSQLLKNMGVEELHLFVRFCNVTGLFPFRMVLDQSTRKFKRLKGQYSLVNWWFIFLSIGRIFCVTVFIYMNYDFKF